MADQDILVDGPNLFAGTVLNQGVGISCCVSPR